MQYNTIQNNTINQIKHEITYNNKMQRLEKTPQYYFFKQQPWVQIPNTSSRTFSRVLLDLLRNLLYQEERTRLRTLQLPTERLHRSLKQSVLKFLQFMILYLSCISRLFSIFFICVIFNIYVDIDILCALL